MVRYTQNNGIEMNGNSGGYGRKNKSQSPDVTSWFEVTSTARNGSAGGGTWRLAKVFNENDEALINRKLPKELLLRVFSHLDVVSLCRCAQVKNNNHDSHYVILIWSFCYFFRSRDPGTY